MKTALITGSSTGIGRETALHLAGLGWRVLAGVRKEADGRSLAEEAKSRGLAGPVEPVIIDITKPEQIEAAATQAANAAGARGLDALINNAGIPIVGPVESLGMDRWRHQFEVNFFGHIAVTRAMLPLLRVARGRVVLVSSIAGLIGQPFLSPYSASKHALEALGDALRIELAPDGIGITLLEPGAIKTPIWKRGEENTRSVEDAILQIASLTQAFPVTRESIPTFRVPHSHVLPNGIILEPLPFYVQVVMYNPVMFPQNPSQWSRAMRVEVDANGNVLTSYWGSGNGIGVRAATFTDSLGIQRMRFPFSIVGMP